MILNNYVAKYLNQNGSRMDLALILDYFRQKEKLVFSLYLWDFTSYLPQHCLYFLPLPQVVETPIFIILIIFIILLIFQGLIVLVTYYIYNIYSIFVIINISLLQTNRKQCLHSFTTVIILSISYIYQCAFCILHIHYTINICFYQ